MRWELWRPWYERIAERLKLDEGADDAAGKILNDLIPEPDLQRLTNLIRARDCIVLGAGPSLDTDLARLERAGFLDKTLIAADGATTAVLGYRRPEIIATDLDGNLEHQLEAWKRGSWLIIHAHGDNIAQIRDFLPKINERVIGTTQVKPFGKLHNFGGFTDGDRAAFMTWELGAGEIYLAGMDLGRTIGKHSGNKDLGRKLIKLEICRELLAWLAGELKANVVDLTTHGKPIPNVRRESLK